MILLNCDDVLLEIILFSNALLKKELIFIFSLFLLKLLMMTQVSKKVEQYKFGLFYTSATAKISHILERTINKFNKHKISILFNKTCIQEELLPKYTEYILYVYTSKGDLS